MPYEELAAEQTVPPRQHRRRFSRLGLGLTVYLVANYILTMAAYELFYALDERGIFSFDQAVNGFPFWITAYVLPSALGLLLFYLIARRVPSQMPEERRPLRFTPFCKIYFILATTGFVFNYLTEILMSLIASLRGAPVSNPVEDFFFLPMPITVFLTCIVAPIAEELTYRRLLIPRLRPYGDRFAIIASALCFSLMHGNLSQFFYAFALGIILGYVFLKTGCVWQTMLLHALFNLVGGVVSAMADDFGDLGSEFYLRLVMCHIGLGAFCLLCRRRGIVYAPGVYPLRAGQKWRFFLLNFGMICFCLVFVVQSVIYLLE